MEMYYRVSYNDMGIYEALKKELWKQKKDPKNEWKILINSNSFSWLRNPKIDYKDCCSYFTKLGYEMFNNNVYPILIKYLDKSNINVNTYFLDSSKLDIIYKDEHQIVINNCLRKCENDE